MTTTFELSEIGRIPGPGDNLAIAIRRLEAGTRVAWSGTEFTLDSTVLEGHRFAIQPIATGDKLLSWGLPFGIATRDINPGDYACNEQILAALRERSIDFELPKESNFRDHIEAYCLDETVFQPGNQAPLHSSATTFLGYRRAASRGVATRNFIVLLGTTSRTASYVRQLEGRTKALISDFPNIDGIVAAGHTEGGGLERPNNVELLLRTLAGFMVNPNVGAVLAVDYGTEPVTNAMLLQYMQDHAYPLEEVPHRFVSLNQGFEANLRWGESLVKSWLETVNDTQRTETPSSYLKIGLQCGGSDAFSGISSNPLLSSVAKEIIQQGGVANLAETDELIGAESYVLKNVRDMRTARQFLQTIERFKERVSWHGATAEGNPSGGNKFRGLYNIVLKSIGAANKLHPDVRLDYVIEYGDRMLQPGFYFMDSPGNDLESVAGQVASGANMIFFTTGNGSITNFPFVPTIKIMNTTRRFQLLEREMDVNAGAYLDGTPMEELTREMFELTLKIASGNRSKGERAGHAQVSIWRNWKQTSIPTRELFKGSHFSGQGLTLTEGKPSLAGRFQALRRNGRRTSDQVGLVLPTSLCASQIAKMSAEHLNLKGIGRNRHVSRFVSLLHTEGCGHSGGVTEEMYSRTMLGYLNHPLVGFALLLEHGCEKMHNDYMRHQAEQQGFDLSHHGWASVQLDGGIDRVLRKIEDWFEETIARTPIPIIEEIGLEGLRLGFTASGPVPRNVAGLLADMASTICATGGTIVVPHNSPLLSEQAFLARTLGSTSAEPSLDYGQRASAGFHIMETPTDHWIETLTGMGATGVEMFVAHVGDRPQQGHPLVPLLQFSGDPEVLASHAEDLDLSLDGDPASWGEELLRLVLKLASRQYFPKTLLQGNHDFQLTRGLVGVSL